MMQLIFRNRYAALAWVGVSLISAAIFVGDGGGREKLEGTAAQVRAQNAAHEAAIAAAEAARSEAAASGETADQGAPPAFGDLEETAEDGVMVGPDGRKYRIVTPEDLAEAQAAGSAE